MFLTIIFVYCQYFILQVLSGAESKRDWRLNSRAWRPHISRNSAGTAAVGGGGPGARGPGPWPCTPEAMSQLQYGHRQHWDPVLGFRTGSESAHNPCLLAGASLSAAVAPHVPAAGAAARHNSANGYRRDSDAGFSFFRWGR